MTQTSLLRYGVISFAPGVLSETVLPHQLDNSFFRASDDNGPVCLAGLLSAHPGATPHSEAVNASKSPNGNQ